MTNVTLRNYFAAKAMAALILRPGPLVVSELSDAYLIADKMIEFDDYTNSVDNKRTLDLTHYAFNYRNAMSGSANKAFQELEKYVDRLICDAIQADRLTR